MKAFPDSLNVALKEWDSVCKALVGGRQMILLRKGGIYESGGQFEIEHRQFVLFPTFVHQKLEMLKPEARDGFVAHAAEPQRIELAMAASITDILEIKSRSAMDALDDRHIWTKPLIDMRFSYRPENPLYLLLLRVYRLDRPGSIANTLAYAGCKSWVPLDEPVSTTGAVPALADRDYAVRRSEILDRISLA